MSDPGDAAEAAADRAADAVVRGEKVEDVGSADGITLHRAITTNGGVFDSPKYDPFVGQTLLGGQKTPSVGLDAIIEFTPNELVEAPQEQIALIQTVKSETNKVQGGSALHATTDQQNTSAATSDPDQDALVVDPGQAGAGRMIDAIAHPNNADDATQNPIFGVMTDASTNLTEGQPSNVYSTRRGDQVRNPDGTLEPPTSARIEDKPRRMVEVNGQAHEMTFEVAALVTDGPLANTYVGSVEWGWGSVDKSVTPKPLRAVASGAPTAGFMGAAQVWNDATMHNTGGTEPTIDLPLTSLPSSVRAVVEMGTQQLLERLKIVNDSLEGLSGPELTNRQFEKRALEAEANRRTFTIKVRCDQLQDTGSAAVPAEDEVWLGLSNGATMMTTSAQTITAGADVAHKLVVGDFLPFDGPLNVRVMEHDRAGKRNRARDHAIVVFDWAPPFDPHVELTNSNGDYTIAVQFDR